MDRAFTSDKYVALVKPDEEVLLDKSKGGMLIADRHLIDGVAGDAAFRLMRFHRVAPLRSTAALADRLRVLPRPEGAAARELYIAVDGAAAGQRVACYDAVEIDWFDAAEAALAFALSADQRDRRRSYAELVRGTDFLIARVNRVL